MTPVAAGAHLAAVEVDPGTGRLTVAAIVVVDDVGRVVNPLLAGGQVAGGLWPGRRRGGGPR